jgi:hypothetical protein
MHPHAAAPRPRRLRGPLRGRYGLTLRLSFLGRGLPGAPGLEDRCAACARKPAWCAGCAQLAAVAVGRCFQVRGAARVRANAAKHAADIYAHHPWRSPQLPYHHSLAQCPCSCCMHGPPRENERPCPTVVCCWSPVCCALHRWPEQRQARLRSWDPSNGEGGDDY